MGAKLGVGRTPFSPTDSHPNPHPLPRPPPAPATPLQGQRSTSYVHKYLRKAGITEAREGDCHYEARGHGRRQEAVRVTPQLRQEADLVALADVRLTGRQPLRRAAFLSRVASEIATASPRDWPVFFRGRSLLWSPGRSPFQLSAAALARRHCVLLEGSNRCLRFFPEVFPGVGSEWFCPVIFPFCLLAVLFLCDSVEFCVAWFSFRVPLPSPLFVVFAPSFPLPLYCFGAVVLPPSPGFCFRFFTAALSGSPFYLPSFCPFGGASCISGTHGGRANCFRLQK